MTAAQVHLFTIFSWALLAVDALLGLLLLRRLWRRAATVDRPAGQTLQVTLGQSPG